MRQIICGTLIADVASICDESIFTDVNTSVTTEATLGNDTLIDVKGKGTISFETNKGPKYIYNVYLVPNLAQNLLSVG